VQTVFIDIINIIFGKEMNLKKEYLINLQIFLCTFSSLLKSDKTLLKL